jgi:hypothetical protein
VKSALGILGLVIVALAGCDSAKQPAALTDTYKHGSHAANSESKPESAQAEAVAELVKMTRAAFPVERVLLPPNSEDPKIHRYRSLVETAIDDDKWTRYLTGQNANWKKTMAYQLMIHDSTILSISVQEFPDWAGIHYSYAFDADTGALVDSVQVLASR